MSTKVQIEFISGDSQKLIITVQDADNAPAAKNLTGATITWALARSRGSAPLITKTVGSGITVTDAANGALEVAIAPADTATIDGVHYHELEVVDSAGNKSTAVYGLVIIHPDSIP